jgi:hypothetical protein
MSLRRFYQTLALDKDDNVDWGFISIPVPYVQEGEPDVLSRFQQRNFQFTEVPAAALPFVIALMLSDEGPRLTPDALRQRRVPLTVAALRESAAFSRLEVAEQIVAQPLILFEHSPVEATSLGQLASEPEFDGARAQVFVATSGETSILFVKHPRVVVIGGIADALRGLNWRSLIDWVLN